MNYQKYFPLKVLNPDIGHRISVLRHDDDRQHQVSLHVSLEEAVAHWGHTVQNAKHLPTLAEYREVEIVPCPSWLNEQYAKAAYEEHLADFAQSCTADAITLWGKHKSTLEAMGFRACSCFKPNKHGHSETCDECHYMGILPPENIEQVFQTTLKPSSYTPVLAEPDPNRTLYVAICDDGHHHNGVKFERVVEPETMYPSSWRNTLFFFHGESLPLPKELKKILNIEIKRREAITKERETQWNKERQEHLQLKLTKLKVLFPTNGTSPTSAPR